MDTFLLSLGWWNFVGSIFMFCLLNEQLGKKILNDSTHFFITEYKLDYWSKFWLFWAIGLNIFFGLINIYAAKWDFEELKIFLISVDLVAYILFLGLAIWGLLAKKCGSGIYSVFVVFGFWIGWGIWVFCS